MQTSKFVAGIIWLIAPCGDSGLTAQAPSKGVEKPKERAKLHPRMLIGKWLMKDGVMEFKERGVLTILDERLSWEMDGSDVVLISNGQKQRTRSKLSGDRLTLVIADEPLVAIRLDSKKYGSGTKWQTSDLAGEWSADDSIKLKLDSKGKGTCDSKFRVGNTKIASIEFVRFEIRRLDDIHVLAIQKMNWIVRLTDDRQSIELIAADDNAVNPSRVLLKRK